MGIKIWKRGKTRVAHMATNQLSSTIYDAVQTIINVNEVFERILKKML